MDLDDLFTCELAYYGLIVLSILISPINTCNYDNNYMIIKLHDCKFIIIRLGFIMYIIMRLGFIMYIIMRLGFIMYIIMRYMLYNVYYNEVYALQ